MAEWLNKKSDTLIFSFLYIYFLFVNFVNGFHNNKIKYK